MLEKVSGSIWVGVLGAFVCLRADIYVNMGYAKWNIDSDNFDTFLTWFCNVVGCTGCHSAWRTRCSESDTALSCTSAMQRTYNTFTIHMEYDVQYKLFTCNLKLTYRLWCFSVPTPVVEWKVKHFCPPRPFCLIIYKENIHIIWILHVCYMYIVCALFCICMRVVCVLHVRCMCVALIGPYKSQPWNG